MSEYNLDKEIEEGLARAEKMIRQRRMIWTVSMAGVVLGLCILAVATSIVATYFLNIRQADAQVVYIEVTSTPEFINPTPTLVAPATPLVLTHEVVNSVGSYGTFSLGLNGVTPDCAIAKPGNRFSQEDIFLDEWMYVTWSEHETLSSFSPTWSLYNLTDGWTWYENQDLDLRLGVNDCPWQGFSLEEAAPGIYAVEVKVDGLVVYYQTFEITYFDVSQIPRPNRPPLGQFVFGRDGVDTDSCKAGVLVNEVTLDDLENDKYVYFASPFQLADVGRTLTWSVYRPNGTAVYEDIQREITDNIDLCWWQGFPLEDEPVGEYLLQIVLDNGETYTIAFKIR